MARRGRRSKNFQSIPPKIFLFALTGVCFLLMLGSYLYGWTSGPVGTIVSYVFVPMQKGMTGLGNAISDKTEEVANLKNVMAENEELKAQLDALTTELNELKLEQYDAQDIRELYELDETYSDYDKIAASVIGKDSGNWFNTFIIDKGEKDGIRVGMNVIAGSGLVGIISETGATYSKVRTIIDDTSSVSGMVLSTSDNCVVNGNLELMDEKQVITFTNLKDTANAVTVGDQIVTSYISSDYLQGLFIGYITEINLNSNNLTKSGVVSPVVDFEHLKHVLVITEIKENVFEEEK